MQQTVCAVCRVKEKRLVAVTGRTQPFYICTSCYFNYFMDPGIPVSEVFESGKEPVIEIPT
ncbi:MAG: hypothetical protein RQ758_00725 [Methanomicrobiaceae archaeon]|nr:hypothetical protein [Methanomicrobiaceae archaeon]